MYKTLLKKGIKGFKWSFIDSFLVNGLLFIAMIYFARILGPSDIGIFAVLTIIVQFSKNISDSGLSSSLIRTVNITDRDYSSVFSINLILSVLSYIVIFISAPLIKNFFEIENLDFLIRIYSLIIFPISFSSVFLVILSRSLDFKKISLINLPSTVISIFIGIILLFNGYGIYSLLFMFFFIEFLKSFLYFFNSKWSPSIKIYKKELIIHFNYGYKLLLSTIIDTIFKNIYTIIIGKSFSVNQLGFFDRAKKFSEYPSVIFTSTLTKVSFPLLSNIQTNKSQLQNLYKKILKVSFFIVCPTMLILASVSKPLFLILLGEKWLDSVKFFQIMCFAMMLYPVHAFNLNIIKVIGRSDLFLKLEIIKKIIIIISIYIGLNYGLIGLVYSILASSILSLFVNMFNSGKMIDYPMKTQTLDLFKIFTLSIVSSILSFYLVNMLEEINYFIQILFSALCGIVLYMILNYIFKTTPGVYFIQLLKSYFEGKV